MDTIALPDKTRQTLIDMLKQRDEINRMIEVVVTTVRDVANVPPDYILRDVNTGFEAPQKEEA
jgi:hypothetical protein